MTAQSVDRIASRKSAFGLFTKPPPLEVFATSAPRSPLCSGSFAQRTEVAIMRSLRQIFRFNVAFGDVSQIASGSHIIWVDLLPPLYLHKSSGKVVLDRSEAVTSCLRE